MLKTFSLSSLDELFQIDKWEWDLMKLKSFSLISWVTGVLLIKPFLSQYHEGFPLIVSDFQVLYWGLLYIWFLFWWGIGVKFPSFFLFFFYSRYPVLPASFVETIVFLALICVFAIFVTNRVLRAVWVYICVVLHSCLCQHHATFCCDDSTLQPGHIW